MVVTASRLRAWATAAASRAPAPRARPKIARRRGKPDDPGERARIEAQGGYVSRASDAYGPARVWKGGFGIGPGLAMSRSLGDHAVAEVGVTAEPVMLTEAITPEDEVLILASDGVWEFISSQEAVAICQTKHPNATAATKELIKQATARWKAAEGNYRDDISAIVVSSE